MKEKQNCNECGYYNDIAIHYHEGHLEKPLKVVEDPTAPTKKLDIERLFRVGNCQSEEVEL